MLGRLCRSGGWVQGIARENSKDTKKRFVCDIYGLEEGVW